MGLPSPVPLKKGKNIIEKKILLKFLNETIDIDKSVSITKVRDTFLWADGDIERHRIDIFEKYEVEGEGEFCWTNRIGERSFFLQYNKEEKTISDRTVGRYVDEKKGLL